jgi:HD-like signal output (HDOD) protein/CheY-like chemotaxis protein
MTDADRCSVLFVDDEPLVLQGLQRMLRSQRPNWTLRFASRGREALELLERESFDAVVSDLRMPEMDGVELLNIVMKNHPDTMRIILSGEMQQGMLLKAVRCAHQFLAKPCDAESLKAALTRAFALRRMISDRRLKALLSRMESLPSLPALYTEVLAEIQSPNPSFKKVGEIIAHDVGMAAKILQLVNSAFFGLPRRIVIPHEAVCLLGYDTVKALVLSAKIFSQFDPKRIVRLSLETLWQHCLRASLCGRTIGSVEKLPRKSQDEAFTAGILHDVGKLILAQNFPDTYGDILAKARARRQAEWDVENECFGVSHAEIGAYLMGLWGLGEEVIGAIAHHHLPPKNAAPGRLTAVMYAANALAHRLSPDPVDATEAEPTTDDLMQLNIAERFGVWEEACRRTFIEEVLRAA